MEEIAEVEARGYRRPEDISEEQRHAEHRMTGMEKTIPKSVDEYIAAQSEAVRLKLEQVRAAIRRAVPEAVEGIGYRMPGYKLHGKPMLYFAGFKEHYSLFAASGTFFGALEDDAITPSSSRRPSHSLIKLCFACRTVRKPVEVTRKYRFALPPLSGVGSPKSEQTSPFFWSRSSVA